MFTHIELNSNHSADDWDDDCDIRGNDIETKMELNSYLQCAEACFKNRKCNYFSYSTKRLSCILKNARVASEAVTSIGIVCGMFPNRIPKSTSNRQWQISKDKSFKWAKKCFYGAQDEDGEGNFSQKTVANITDCALHCKSNSNCNYFVMNNENNRCYLKESNKWILTEEKVSAYSCGFLTKRC